jgi:uncharacterized protein involved in outer membrane biogenesis
MRWKWILGILAVLVVAVFFAVFVVLSSYDFNKHKAYITQVVKDATGRELTLEGDIDLKIGFSPALTVDNVRFENAQWGARPDLIRLKHFEVQVALIPLIRGNVKVRRLILDEPDILIETDKNGKSNLDFDLPEKAVDEVQKEEPSGLPVMTFNKLLIRNGLLTYTDGQTGKTSVVKLNTLKGNTKGIRESLEIELNGEYNNAPFEAEGTLGPLTLITDPDKAWPVNVTTKAVGVGLALDGTIKDVFKQEGIAVNFSVNVEDFSKLEKLAGKPLPFKEKLAVTGAVSDPSPRTYRISDFKITFGESDMGGVVETNFARKRPHFMAVLSSEKLDLRPLMTENVGRDEAEQTGTTGEKKRDKVFPDDPLPLDALKQADGTVKINIKQLLLQRVAIDDLKGELILKDGRLTLKPLQATVGGGVLAGRFDLQPRDATAVVSTAMKVNQIDIGNMLKELDITDRFEGKLDIDYDLESSGKSIAEMMAKLNGNTSIVMGKGRVYSKYVNLLGGDFSTSVFRLINPVGEKEEFTEINCYVSRFDIKDGLADNTALVFDSSRMSVVGKGMIDLKTEKLDLSLKPVPKERIGAEGIGQVGMSIGELSKPFKLGGTLANPSLAIDPLQTALTVGKMARGMALFGPVGIAAALVSTESVDENPCIAAIEAAKTGVKAPEKKGITQKTTEGISESVKGVGKGLKKLFGK